MRGSAVPNGVEAGGCAAVLHRRSGERLRVFRVSWAAERDVRHKTQVSTVLATVLFVILGLGLALLIWVWIRG